MSRRVAEVEVELLRPNEAAFGAPGGAGFVDVADDDEPDPFDDEPRPRWTMAIAGLLVTGLLAAGVVAAAPWSDDPVATPPTSTTTPPTSTTEVRPPRTTAAPDPLAGVATEPEGWIITPSEFWAFAGAWSNGVAGQPGVTGRADVWAARDATRADGPWITVRSDAFSSGLLAEDGVRTLAGDRPAVITTDDDGSVTVTATTSRNGSVMVQGLGVRLDQLMAIAATAVPPEPFDDGGGIHYGDLRSREGVFGLPLRTSRKVSYGGTGTLGSTLASSYWSEHENSTAGIDLWAVDDGVLDSLDFLLRPVDVPPQLSDLVDRLAAMGRDVSVYEVPDQPGVQVVLWPEGDVVVSVTGYGPTATLAQLLTIARAARPADRGEWLDLLTESQQGIELEADHQPASMYQAGAFEDGSTWNATMSEGGWFWMNGPDAGWYAAAGAGDVPAVHRFAAPDVTVWVAVDPTGVARTMRVTPADGSAPVTVPMESLDGATVAFHARHVDVAATVELLDESGAVVLSRSD